MKIEIVEETEVSTNSGRIVEIEEGELVVDTCFVCESPVDIRPSNSDHGYCCQEHKNLHFPEDETEPFPFHVKYRPEIGRYLVAARDIQPGELIFNEEPLAMGPNHTTLPTCLECMRSVDGSYLCPNCNLPVCEEMCAYGEEHSKECQIFSPLEPKLCIEDFTKNSPIYWSITALRALSLKQSDPKKFRIIQRMMDHNKNHAQDAENWELYKEHVVDFLLNKCNLSDIYSSDEIFHVLGALDVNSVAIHATPSHSGDFSGPVDLRPGHALFAVTSLMSHGCISNSKTLIKSDYSSECRATSFIRAGDEITKQYVSALETTPMRRRRLRAGWYFDCKCPRCCDPTENDSFVSATRCLKCGEGTILPHDPLNDADDAVWKCDACGYATNLGAVQNLVQYFLSKLSEPNVGNTVEGLENLLEKSVKLFHPQHYIATLIRIKLNAAYVRLAHRMFRESEEYKDREFDIPTEVYMRRKELLDDIHRTIDIVEPGQTRRRGLSLFEMATCHLQLGRQLYESDRFSKMDFVTLIKTEMDNLQEAIDCLKYSRDGTYESTIHYRAQGALYEAETTLRVLLQSKSSEDDEPSPEDSSKPVTSPEVHKTGDEEKPKAETEALIDNPKEKNAETSNAPKGISASEEKSKKKNNKKKK